MKHNPELPRWINDLADDLYGQMKTLASQKQTPPISYYPWAASSMRWNGSDWHAFDCMCQTCLQQVQGPAEPTEAKVCECGSQPTDPGHYSWCPLYKDPAA